MSAPEGDAEFATPLIPRAPYFERRRRVIDVDYIFEQVKGARAYGRRNLLAIQGVMVHRVGKDLRTGADLGDTAEEICRAFTSDPVGKWTGYKVPYTFIIDAQGRVAQCLPLDLVGPHARALSGKYVGVAYIGDFREHEPSPAQWANGLVITRVLLGALGLGVNSAVGHTDPEMVARGSTGDPAKECPGKLFSLGDFRRALVGGLVLTEG